MAWPLATVLGLCMGSQSGSLNDPLPRLYSAGEVCKRRHSGAPPGHPKLVQQCLLRPASSYSGRPGQCPDRSLEHRTVGAD